jgi:hypothetical protein
LRVEPEPNPEEVAAIMAALAIALEDDEEPEEVSALRRRSRWGLAGLLGHPPPREMKLEGSIWSYSSWEGMV